jgi:hypothetical protein
MGTSFKEDSGTSGSNKNPGTTIPAGADVVPFLIVPPCCAITGGGVIVITRVRARKSDSPDLQASRSEERFIIILLHAEIGSVRDGGHANLANYSMPLGEGIGAKSVMSKLLMPLGADTVKNFNGSSRRIAHQWIDTRRQP